MFYSEVKHLISYTDSKLIAYWVIFHAFLSSAELFEKILSRIPSEYQSVQTLIRPDQSVCQGYQQTLVDKELIEKMHVHIIQTIYSILFYYFYTEFLNLVL